MLTYNFYEIKSCEMCGSPSVYHKIMGQRLNRSQGLFPSKKDGISVSVKKCSNCNLIYTSPLPIPSNILDHYGIPPEEYWQNQYFQWSTDYFSEQINELKNLIPFVTGMKALDIGAGLGKCMLSLENAGFDAYGFEPSTFFYRKALEVMKISPDKLKLDQIETVHYPVGTFDFITFGAVLEHIYHPLESIERAMKWLKPGGIIHIEVPSSKHLISRLINLYFKLTCTNYVTNLSPMHAPFHLYEFDLDSFRKGKLNGKLKLVSHRFDVCDLSPLPKILHPIFRYLMKKSSTGMQLTVYLKKHEEI